MIKVPYYSELVNLRIILEDSLPNFPELRCQHSTRVVNRILGLEERAGYYKPLDLWHAWNYDPNQGLYIDLTMDQFSGDHEPITILRDNTSLLSADDERTKFQIESFFDFYTESIERCVLIYRVMAAKS